MDVTCTKKLHPDFIKEIKERVDIVDVISGYIALKPNGRDYTGLCPFHDEKSPSFSVSPDKGFAYCFGCTWGGDAIKFLMEHLHISFVDAVLDQARKHNIPIQYADGSTDSNYPAPLPRKPQRKAQKSTPTPAPIPDTRELAKLPAPVIHPEKRKRGANIEIEYPYSATQWVLRTEKPNPEKPKGYEKITLPYHLNENGEEVCGKGSEAWPAYRMDEIKAYGAGKWILGVEGESCVEAARYLNLVSFTLQGGSWSDGELSRAMLQLEEAGVAGMLYFPDHDVAGYEKARKMAEAAAKAGLPFVQLNPLAIWEECPDKGDIADWVKWGMEQGWSKEEFIRQLEKQFQKAAFSLIEEQKTNDPDEILKMELKALGKETDPIKFMRKRAEIASHYRLRNIDIDKAIKYLSEAYQTAKPRDMGLDELFDMSVCGIEYVVPGMLPIAETALLVANPKAGKSLLAYDLAFAVATGENYFLNEPVKQGRVLIVQCDESINTARGRLLKRGFRREDAANVRFMDSFNIEQLGELEAILESFRPTLVIIDSLRRISAGREISENSAEFADAVYSLKELISRYNAAGLLIHHTSKNQEAVGVERVRGSSAIAGAVWGVWQLDQIAKPDPNNKKRMVIDPKDPTRILSIIARDVEGQRLKIELNPENNSWISHGEEFLSEEQAAEHKSNVSHGHLITELLKSVAPTGLEASEINEQLKIGRGIYSALNRLVGQKIIGARPSMKDRRRTVYFVELSQPESTVLSQLNSGQVFDNTPPPYTYSVECDRIS